MLSTNSSSSIQKRRQTHRRQQSLEVPTLTTQLPANQRRHPPGHHGHRRGLSLDQSLAVASPTGFRPLFSQEAQPTTGSPSVRIQLDTTNLGQPPTDTQHFTQVTQQHIPAQPGHLAQDFQSHLHQQLNGLPPPIHQPTPQPITDIKPLITSPHLSHSPQQQALQELQHHMEWYRNAFGTSPQPNMPATPLLDLNQSLPAEMMPTIQMPMAYPVPGMPQTPVTHGQAHTVPNTPQAYWPSPPPTHGKHARSQSFQLDVAPMPGSFATQFSQQSDSFNDAAAFADQGYASSAYSSSAVDPTSPGHQLNAGPMPTLFEEDTPPMGANIQQGGFDGSSILLQATAGAQGFNDPDFDFGGPQLMSPRQQLLNNLGPEVPASIVDTGVQAHEVQQYMGELSDVDNKYPCLYEGCNRRFGRKENVRAHIQTHLGDRQFKCNLCDKTFVRQHDLKRHIAIHSDDRPFVCPCGTGFARHDALTRHRQRGMCHGALPGFEKTEEEKPKRGRPKKERPDLESRTEKSSKQRKKNKSKTAADTEEFDFEQPMGYASSSSGASDRSFPVTPPDTSDTFDTDAFLNMANSDVQFNSVTSSWRDTPPTSPVSASPAKTADSYDNNFNLTAPVAQPQSISPALLSTYSTPPADGFTGESSPAQASYDDNFDDVVNTQPDVGFDPFSPPGESNSSASAYTDDFGYGKDLAFVGGGGGSFGDLMVGGPMPEMQQDMLDDWLLAT